MGGAAAGTVVEAVLYPIDTIKTRLQAGCFIQITHVYFLKQCYIFVLIYEHGVSVLFSHVLYNVIFFQLRFSLCFPASRAWNVLFTLWSTVSGSLKILMCYVISAEAYFLSLEDVIGSVYLYSRFGNNFCTFGFMELTCLLDYMCISYLGSSWWGWNYFEGPLLRIGWKSGWCHTVSQTLIIQDSICSLFLFFCCSTKRFFVSIGQIYLISVHLPFSLPDMLRSIILLWVDWLWIKTFTNCKWTTIINRASALFIGVYEPTKQKLVDIMPQNLSAIAHLVITI